MEALVWIVIAGGLLLYVARAVAYAVALAIHKATYVEPQRPRQSGRRR